MYSQQQIARLHASQQRLLSATTTAQPSDVVQLSLHEADLVIGDEDGLCALFYEYCWAIPSIVLSRELAL